MIRGIHKLAKARPSCPVVRAVAAHYGIENQVIHEEADEKSSSSHLKLSKSSSKERLKRHDPREEWQLLEGIGEGGFSKIYKARHLHTGEIAAAKIVLDQEDSKEIFRNELAILNRIKHKNIVNIIEAYEFDYQFWVCDTNIDK